MRRSSGWGGRETIKAFNDAADWLEKTLLPNSKGSYAIGAENFELAAELRDRLKELER